MHPRVRRISVGVLSITPVYRGLEFLQHLDLRPAGHHAEKDAYGSSRRVSRQRLRLNDLVKNSPTTEVEIADGNIELIKSLEREIEDAPRWSDPRRSGALPDPYIAMGQTAENVAQLQSVTREEQDAFAARSQNRAEASIADGFWASDITPVTLPDGTIVRTDDGPRAGVTVETLAGLDPVFRPGGTVTAGNCCPLNDGAAAVVIMSGRLVEQLDVTPLARIVSTAASALSPEIMGLGPVEASRRALDRAGLVIDDIDLVEINEAFAAQVIPAARELGVDAERLNIHGGAIAIGHPFGMTGARITSTLINGLVRTGGRYGLETMCVGGGQGMAMIVERL